MQMPRVNARTLALSMGRAQMYPVTMSRRRKSLTDSSTKAIAWQQKAIVDFLSISV